MLENIINKISAYAEPLIFIAAWVTTFSFIRFILSPRKRTLYNLLSTMFISVPTGVIIGAAVRENGMGEFTSTFIACIAAVMANDILFALIKNPSAVFQYADRIITNIIDRKTR